MSRRVGSGDIVSTNWSLYCRADFEVFTTTKLLQLSQGVWGGVEVWFGYMVGPTYVLYVHSPSLGALGSFLTNSQVFTIRDISFLTKIANMSRFYVTIRDIVKL